ncbi:DUF3100 domain-containing protein [Bradyrhizobium sp. CER78]|uniref:DUF3100 domain-containing protein n=1 Tax=Bradyrhizobium sp. CER78 TaxID=3039162 RepID=UPI002448057B|nr:DUF3100 domain-containing protein [Bradyrhizobium sp. CER78]MDH2383210.1 DUF3100 domain-containing protein [Bradyrhizobium sp. CER78]
MTSTSSPSADQSAQAVDSASSGKLTLFVAVLIIVAVAETIGIVQFQIGPGTVLLQPMVWALLIAAAWGLSARYLPAAARIGPGLQTYAGQLLNAGLLLFVVKMAFTVGGALPEVQKAGWALLFQELGHTFGTLVLGLPIALLLGVKREAVGATFSIGREGNLVIIGEKYGMNSAEGRGVLAEYITGTVLGALFIALLAGFVASLHIFDPRSLAMGAGVGSGSMMAAAIGTINGHNPPEMAKELIAIASAANLMTAVLGFYFALFFSLPVCSWLYDRLEPVLGRFSNAKLGDLGPSIASVGETKHGTFGFSDSLLAWITVAGGVLIGNSLTYKVPLLQSGAGLLVVLAVVLLVDVLARLLTKVPHILILVVVTTVLGIPGLLPFSKAMIGSVDKLNFLAFTTPVLTLAGFSVAKDLPIFRKLSWRIVVVSLTAAAGTFLGATLIAEFFHR